MGEGALKSRGLPHRTQCRRSLSSSQVPESGSTSLGKKIKSSGAKLGLKLCAGRSGSSTLTPPAIYVYIQSHQSKGQREGVVAKSKLNQEPNGLGLEWKHHPTVRSLTTTFTGETGEKRLSSAKKTSQNGLSLGGHTATDFHTRCRRGYKKWIPIRGQVSGTSQHTTSTSPSINHSTENLSEWKLIDFSRSSNQLCQRVAVFQAEGGPSFVPLRVLLPFSLEETAAPAERKEERRRDITTMWRRGKGNKEPEELVCKILQQRIFIFPHDFRRVRTAAGRRFSLLNIQSFQEFILKTKIWSLLQNLAGY